AQLADRLGRLLGGAAHRRHRGGRLGDGGGALLGELVGLLDGVAGRLRARGRGAERVVDLVGGGAGGADRLDLPLGPLGDVGDRVGDLADGAAGLLGGGGHLLGGGRDLLGGGGDLV